MSRRVGRALAGLATVVALAGCGSANSAGSVETPAVLAGLCRAQAADDPAQVEAHFAGAHRQLHQLASEVEQRDRATAAALLRAKQAVEARLAQPPGARSATSQELPQLASAVRDALRAVDRPAPPCEQDDGPGG